MESLRKDTRVRGWTILSQIRDLCHFLAASLRSIVLVLTRIFNNCQYITRAWTCGRHPSFHHTGQSPIHHGAIRTRRNPSYTTVFLRDPALHSPLFLPLLLLPHLSSRQLILTLLKLFRALAQTDPERCAHTAIPPPLRCGDGSPRLSERCVMRAVFISNSEASFDHRSSSTLV